jgi:hypothetical protein
MKDTEDTAMPDPIARKRLKKKMLDRWENEGGRIATDTTSADASRPTGEDKGHSRKRSSPSDKSSVSVPASPTKRRKPTQK